MWKLNPINRVKEDFAVKYPDVCVSDSSVILK
jgi:hypothetical protein